MMLTSGQRVLEGKAKRVAAVNPLGGDVQSRQGSGKTADDSYAR